MTEDIRTLRDRAILRPTGRYFDETGANSTGMDIHLVLFSKRSMGPGKRPAFKLGIGKDRYSDLEDFIKH